MDNNYHRGRAAHHPRADYGGVLQVVISRSNTSWTFVVWGGGQTGADGWVLSRSDLGMAGSGWAWSRFAQSGTGLPSREEKHPALVFTDASSLFILRNSLGGVASRGRQGRGAHDGRRRQVVDTSHESIGCADGVLRERNLCAVTLPAVETYALGIASTC